MEMNGEAEVLPENKKKRSETHYTIVYTNQNNELQLLDAESWAQVKKEANNLADGCEVIKVLRVTAVFEPQKKTVLEF